MDIDFECKNISIEPATNRRVSVSAVELNSDYVAEQVIPKLRAHQICSNAESIAALLDEIGVDACKAHFNLKDSED